MDIASRKCFPKDELLRLVNVDGVVTPDIYQKKMWPMFDQHLVNMVGGCCGTTPEFIHTLRKHLSETSPGLELIESRNGICSGRQVAEIRVTGSGILPAAAREVPACA